MVILLQISNIQHVSFAISVFFISFFFYQFFHRVTCFKTIFSFISRYSILSPEAIIGDASKEGLLENFRNFRGKHLCWSLLFNKVAGLQACNFFKRSFQHRYFLEKFTKFSKAPFLKNICAKLHLQANTATCQKKYLFLCWMLRFIIQYNYFNIFQ